MAKIELMVTYESIVSGILRRQGASRELGRYFVHIPPEKRRISAAHHCPVGGEGTRDYWYSHDTGKAGDLKLCREHEVFEILEPGARR